MDESHSAATLVDCDFGDAPLMLTLAHVSFTESPEIIDRISEMKAGLATKLGLPVAQMKTQASFTLNPAVSPTPAMTQTRFWWFSNVERTRAVAVAANSIVLYDSLYGRFSQFIDRIADVLNLTTGIAGHGCFLRSVALRYISGFPVGGEPSPYLTTGLHGLPRDATGTTHSHHHYSYWCATDRDTQLVCNVRTVHGNQLVPRDVSSAGIAIQKKFTMSKDAHAVQLDIHETAKAKTMEPLDTSKVLDELAQMRQSLKRVFLATTTPQAHQLWKILN